MARFATASLLALLGFAVLLSIAGCTPGTSAAPSAELTRPPAGERLLFDVGPVIIQKGGVCDPRGWHGRDYQSVFPFSKFDWTSPEDYINGTLHQRMEIISWPSSKPFLGCTFLNEPGLYGDHWWQTMPYITKPGVFTLEWTVSKMHDDTGLLGRLNNPPKFRGVFLPKDGKLGTAANIPWSNEDIYPVTIRLTWVLVAKGRTFSGWKNYGLSGPTETDGTPSDTPVTAGKTLTLDLGGDVKMRLVKIPAGMFIMGSPTGEAKRDNDEGPRHRVTITKPFYMGTCEVTQEQYQAVMNENPSHFKGEKNPVEKISWNDAVAFCKTMSRKTGREVRLPTEAEWEYTCRAGATTPFNTGNTISTDLANYDGDETYGDGRKGADRKKPIAVGSFKPNAFGLYDMHGNVWEWCSDWYGAQTDTSADPRDPAGPTSGRNRVLRGGSWSITPWYCRSAYRDGNIPGTQHGDIGFRVVVSPGLMD